MIGRGSPPCQKQIYFYPLKLWQNCVGLTDSLNDGLGIVTTSEQTIVKLVSSVSQLFKNGLLRTHPKLFSHKKTLEISNDFSQFWVNILQNANLELDLISELCIDCWTGNTIWILINLYSRSGDWGLGLGCD